MNEFLSSQNLKKAVKYLLYAATITPAVVLGNVLFPYISSRTIFFRTVIELAVIIFLFILAKNKFKLIGKRNYFLWVFSAFIIANIISSFFSFSILISWFSDIERMWGVFTIIHLWLFYFLLRSFFTGKDWKIFFNIFIAVSLYVSFYGIIQYYPEVFNMEVFSAGKTRIISTLGNSAYVAIYTAFSAFFALFLLLKTSNRWWQAYYFFAVIINFFAFSLAGIRGTTLGLIAAFTATSLLYILLGRNKKAKVGIAAVVILGSSLLFFAFLNPNSSIVKSNSILTKISSISLFGGTAETRFIGWNAAWQGFKEHPIFGVGMDNFNVVFNKYFNADYYLIAPSEPYFDRSHNAILDVLVMNGMVGFIIFLGFPFFIFYYLIKGYKEEKIMLDEFLLFSGLTITYFVHLIFVFDDLNSYSAFVAMFAFIEYRYHKDVMVEFGDAKKESKFFIPIIISVFILLITYQLNIRVGQACKAAVDPYKYNNDLEKITESFQKAINYNIIPSRNVVLAYVNYLVGAGSSLQEILQDKASAELLRKGILDAGEAIDKEIKKDPYNAMLYSRKAELDNIAYVVNNNSTYIDSAIENNNKAISLSREHLQYYYSLANSYIISNRPSEAIKIIQDAIAVNGRYMASYYHLARVYLADRQLEQALKTARIFVNLGQKPPDNSFFLLLAKRFKENSDIKGELAALELARESEVYNEQILTNLIRVYLSMGETQKAINMASELAEIDKKFEQDSQYIIQEIQADRIQGLLEQLGG
ncbi:MAG: O-antigen ligase family protein [Patescibacteria group bacterium]|jgi:O-antigen ligase